MDAEQVVEKILSDARGEADKITKEAEEKEAAQWAQTDEQLVEYKKETEVLAQRAGEEKKAHMLAAARMAVAKEYLAEKRKILDDVFAEAAKKLRELSDEQYREIMTRLMKEAIETGDEEVVVDENERRIDQRFIKHLNRELGPGFKGNLRLSQERQKIGGGFILKRGRIKNNVSVGVLLSQARKTMEIELAKELFEG